MTTLLATMQADELKAWMTANGWTVRTLTTALGMPKGNWRTVQRWRDGESRIPPHLPLALQALGRRETTYRNPSEVGEEPITEDEDEITREPFPGD